MDEELLWYKGQIEKKFAISSCKDYVLPRNNQNAETSPEELIKKLNDDLDRMINSQKTSTQHPSDSHNKSSCHSSINPNEVELIHSAQSE